MAKNSPAARFLLGLLFAVVLFTVLIFPETTAELEQQLKQAPETEKSVILNKLAKLLRYDNPEKALEYGQKALENARKFKKTGGEISALINISRALRQLRDYDRALQYAKKSVELAEKNNNKKEILRTTNLLISAYFYLPDYPDNIPNWLNTIERMISISREIGDKESEAKWHLVIGNIYHYFKGDMEKAAAHKTAALKLYQEMGDFSKVVFLMDYLGIIYSQMGDNKKALHYYLSGIKILEKEGGNHLSGRIYFGIFEFYYKLKNFKKAQKYIEKAIEFYKEVEYGELYLSESYRRLGDLLKDRGEFDRALSYLHQAQKIFMNYYKNKFTKGDNPIYLYMSLGQVYEKKKEYQKALSQFREALKFAVSFQRTHLQALCFRYIGEIQLKINNLEKANENFNKSLQVAKEFEDASLIKDNYKLLSELYEKRGRYKKSLEYYRLYADLKDRIYSEESAKSLAEMQTRYETEKKEQEIASLKQKDKIKELSLSQQRIIRNVSIAGFVMIVLIMAYFVKKYYYILVSWKKKHHISRYRVMDKIASGGMGIIYKAHDFQDKTKTLAIKVLRDEYFDDEIHKKRFKSEALVIDRLDHPNIIKILERGESGGNLYIAMELLRGKTLDAKLQEEGQLSIKECLHIMIQIADALALIHSKDIVHRDLKPANIMLIEKDGDTNFVKLLDFGLAKMKFQTRLTGTGMLVGTLNYMPPEYMAKSEFSSASDIYSLGVTFYELITGKTAFPGDTAIDIMKQVLDITPVEPRRFRLDIPAELSDLVMKMLSKDTQSRPDINTILENLKRIQSH